MFDSQGADFDGVLDVMTPEVGGVLVVEAAQRRALVRAAAVVGDRPEVADHSTRMRELVGVRAASTFAGARQRTQVVLFDCNTIECAQCKLRQYSLIAAL